MSVIVNRGCLLKIKDGKATLHMSAYCSEDLRKTIEERAKQIVSRLDKAKESYQGIITNVDHILMENFSKTEQIRFTWSERGMHSYVVPPKRVVRK